MKLRYALTIATIFVSSSSLAQQKTMEVMNGECKANSQFTKTTEAELEQKKSRHSIYKCNSALIIEYHNGRVVVLFSPGESSGGLAVGYSGTYVKEQTNSTQRNLNVDSIYFYGKDYDQSRKQSDGFCQIDQKQGKVSFVACLSATRMKSPLVIVSSAIFEPSSYKIEQEEKSVIPAPTAPSKPQREPWYGVSADGGRCVSTDMSPAERIEWLRERGVRYDAIDYAGPQINGRVPKVTIIPKTGNYPNWVYYGSRAFCEEKETRIEKYR